MKFILVENPVVWWPVTVRVPDPAAPGKMAEQTLKVQFSLRDRDEVLERQEFYETLPTESDRFEAEADDMVGMIIGWDDVVDGNGNPVVFSEKILRAAWKKTWFRMGVHAALAEILLGKDAKLGN